MIRIIKYINKNKFALKDNNVFIKNNLIYFKFCQNN